jgi:hypothetical protein
MHRSAGTDASAPRCSMTAVFDAFVRVLNASTPLSLAMQRRQREGTARYSEWNVPRRCRWTRKRHRPVLPGQAFDALVSCRQARHSLVTS